MAKAAITIIIPILDKDPTVESAITIMMKINQAMISQSPPKAEREAHIIVDWKVILETTVTLARVNKAIVTGMGIIFEEEVVRVLFVEFVVLVLLVIPESVLFEVLVLTQNLLSATNGGVQAETHLLDWT